jgi:hypothetical protein
MKEFIVKENAGFRLRVKSWKCVSPSDLTSLEFIQESKDDKGEVTETSTYQFFLTDLEIKTLTEGLLK